MMVMDTLNIEKKSIESTTERRRKGGRGGGQGERECQEHFLVSVEGMTH